MEPVEALRSFYLAASRDDLDAMLDLLHDGAGAELELIPPDRSPEIEPVRGAENIRAWWADLRETVGELAVEAEEFLEGEDRIVVLVRLRVRPRDTDAEFELSIAHLWTLRDGRLVRCQIFPERERALEAAGLSG